MMDKEMLEQFQMIMQGMNQMEQRIDEKMQKQTETLIKMMDEKISAAETRINIKIKNLLERKSPAHVAPPVVSIFCF